MPQRLDHIVGDVYLNPRCSPSMLDLYLMRHSLLQAVRAHLPRLTGIVVDIGSGDSPYKPLILSAPSRARKYVAMDLEETVYQQKPDVVWDGRVMPFIDNSVDCAFATELLEHCPEPMTVISEAWRILKPGGVLFLTTPFLWPLHCVPHDEYRYTPFALERVLGSIGFEEVDLRSLGGWDMALAQMIGLWVRRRPMSAMKRAICSVLATPIIRYMGGRGRQHQVFAESSMIIGIYGAARKPRGAAAAAEPGNG